MRVANLLLFPFFIVGSCTQPELRHPLGFPKPPRLETEEVLGGGAMQRVLSSLMDGGPAPTVYGNVREIRARTICQPAVPASNPVPGSYNRPVVGQEFVLKWHVEVLNPRPRAVSLLCSTQPPPAPAPLDAYGAPGCVLLVQPDFVLVPQQATSGLLTYSPTSGVVTLRWTPPVHMLGQRLTAQILVAVPGANQAGHLLGPAVEIIVGNQ